MPEKPLPDPMTLEVDNLLGQLKSNPLLEVGGRGGPNTPIPRPAVGTARDRNHHAWIKVGLVTVLAIALPLWPYTHACGAGLIVYLAALGILLAATAWALWAAWHDHTGLAHGLGLAVLLWGVGLSLSQVLPRVGYAQHAATWSCEAGLSPPATPAVPVADPAAPAPAPGEAAQPADPPPFF